MASECAFLGAVCSLHADTLETPLNSPIPPNFAELLQRLRTGDAAALGTLLQSCRAYLRILARTRINGGLQRRFSESDVVQDTFVAVQCSISQFRGATQEEFLAWLRAVMASVFADLVRRHKGAKMRDLRLERRIHADLDRTSSCLANQMLDSIRTPSEQLVQREQSLALAEAIESLPPHYRDVIVLHMFQGLTLAAIAKQLDKTVNAVQKTWVRALIRLQKSLESPA